MSATISRRVRPLTDGQQRRLFRDYRRAHAAFGRGDFRTALGRYKDLSEQLRPQFAAIVGRNFGGETPIEGDLNDEQIDAMLAGRLANAAARLRPGSREDKTASLCSALAHDIALVARHLAESSERGRDPDVAKAIIAGFCHAIAVSPGNAINYHNLGGYEDYLGRDAEACAHYEIACRLNQHQWESWVSWGHAFARLGNLEDAEQCWSNALMIADAVQPQYRDGRMWAIAMLRLLKGDFERGWNDYEGRLVFPPYVEKHGRPDLKAPLWNPRAA